MRKSPSGIIPMIEATIDCMLDLISSLSEYCCMNMNIPMGMMIIPAHFTILLRERIISDCSPFLVFFA